MRYQGRKMSVEIDPNAGPLTLHHDSKLLDTDSHVIKKCNLTLCMSLFLKETKAMRVFISPSDQLITIFL